MGPLPIRRPPSPATRPLRLPILGLAALLSALTCSTAQELRNHAAGKPYQVEPAPADPNAAGGQ